MSARSSLRGRSTVSWGVLDQAMSSGQTYLLIVLAARALSAVDVGAIAFAFEFYILAVFIGRGVSGDPLTTRFSGRTRAGLREPTRAAASTAVCAGVLVGVVIAVIAMFVDDPLRTLLFVAAVAMPGLILQDFVRSSLIVHGRVRSTFVNDTVWTIGQVPAILVASAISSNAAMVFGAWAATGCLAALLGLVQLHLVPAHPRAVRGWLGRTRDLWPYYLGDNLLFELTTLLFVVVVSATAGLAATAGFRVAMTIYAPLSLIGRGVISVAVAMLSRKRDDPVEVRRQALLISTVLTPMAFCWGLLTLLIPTWLGRALFADSWAQAQPLVFLACFVCASGLFSTGIAIGLRSLGAGRHTLAGRVVASIGAGTAATVGGLLGGVHGVFVGLAIFFPIQATSWWLLLRHAALGTGQQKVSAPSLDVE